MKFSNGGPAFLHRQRFEPLEHKRNANLPGQRSRIGTNSLRIGTFDFTPDPPTSTPGNYAIYGTITFGGHTRTLYAPEIAQLKPSLEPPVPRQPSWVNDRFRFDISGFAGQKLAVQMSPDSRDRTWIATNTLSGFDRVFSDFESGSNPPRYYRVVLLP